MSGMADIDRIYSVITANRPAPTAAARKWDGPRRFGGLSSGKRAQDENR